MNILYVMDIDGTIADASRRFEKAGPEPTRYDRDTYSEWLDRVQSVDSLRDDKPVPGMNAVTWAFWKSQDVVYVTSREAKYRPVTEEWLRKHDFPSCSLYMRPNGGWDEAHEFKEKTIDRILLDWPKKVDLVIVVDDDPSGELEKVCRFRGWTFLKARSGL